MIGSYLKGLTLQQIVDLANASGTKPRRTKLWTRTVVKKIITNQFNAGVTTFGKGKTIGGKRLPVPPSQWVTGTGQHTPIIDAETYLAILNETERRDGLRSRSQTYTLTGLLTCSICGGKLHRHGKVKSPYPVDLSCLSVPPHVNIYYHLALQIVSQELVKALTHINPPESVENSSQALLGAISQQEELRRQVQNGYKARIYTQAEASKEIVAIETEIARLQRQHDRNQQHATQRAQILQLAQTDLAALQNWILHDDPTTVNRLLTALCERIEITPSYQLTIIWR